MRAMILAAGRGERMRPLTDVCPKPLLKAGGKPLLQWHIEALVQAGIIEIVVNHAHLGQQIAAYFGDGQSLGARLMYSAESTALETAGGIAQALHLLNPDHLDTPFLVINGDVHCDWPVKKALDIEQSWAPGQQAHLVMVPNPDHNPAGDFELQGHTVHDRTGHEGAFTFSGIGLYAPSLFQAVVPGTVFKLAPLLRSAMQQGTVTGELHTGRWMDIGTPARLDELNQLLQHKAGRV
ncbi:nucleotidyltransferase family protein [Limnobacter humi]|uniref:Nucleotidyltransferase family protein n=1 Tax=Limnobacter humi TaxID=1778671 RepID=A0ABT1WH99_9BURK|nr:nucleotidyltransferase family protein [Limnobacter humi]MCQ8896898.1 nucleotidyltransferase family protein [Limnobacter humi]